MTDPSLLYSIQNDIFVALKKIQSNLKFEKACNKTQNYFEKHERDLEALWKDFSTNHEKLITEGKNKRDLYFRSSMFAVAEGIYKTTQAKLHQMHQYYKLTKFTSDEQGSSQNHEVQEINEKQEIEENIDRGNSDMDTEMIMNMEEPNSGVEFISVELLLNELSAQTTTKKDETDVQQKTLKTEGNIDLSVLEQFDEQPDRKVRCPFKDCVTHFTNKDRMIRHIRLHNGEMPFQCNYCDYATYNSTRIQEHINTHSGIKPYKCSYCKYSSVSKKYLKQHEAKHCKCECGYVSKNRSSLETHQANCLLAEEKKTKFSCKYCKKGFATKVSSHAHKQERGLCSLCDDFVCDLNEHTKKLHGVSVEVPAKKVKIKNYKFTCKLCGWKGWSEMRVLFHLIHHPQPVGEHIDVSILKKYNIL